MGYLRWRVITILLPAANLSVISINIDSNTLKNLLPIIAIP